MGKNAGIIILLYFGIGFAAMGVNAAVLKHTEEKLNREYGKDAVEEYKKAAYIRAKGPLDYGWKATVNTLVWPAHLIRMRVKGAKAYKKVNNDYLAKKSV